jgi:hypothetical protein
VIPRYYPQVPPREKVGLAPLVAVGLVVWMLAHHGLIDLSDLRDLGRDLGKVPNHTHHAPHAKRHNDGAATAPPPASAPGSGGRLSPASIYAYARRAGFTPAEARVATAIAMAESGGRPRAHNPVPPDDSYCLMQVNMLGALGPERRARFHLRSNSDLYDPATCMRAAYSISGGGSSWQPWTTYTRGSYRSYLALSDQLGRG